MNLRNVVSLLITEKFTKNTRMKKRQRTYIRFKGIL